MVVRKIALMHLKFGYSGGCCNECSNFGRFSYHDKKYSKCSVYGITNSDASDWSGRYECCGMKNKEWKEKPIISIVQRDKKEINPIPGQISLFESINN